LPLSERKRGLHRHCLNSKGRPYGGKWNVGNHKHAAAARDPAAPASWSAPWRRLRWERQSGGH